MHQKLILDPVLILVNNPKQHVLVCHPYVTHKYSCHPHVTRMYSYVTRMYLYVIRMSVVCTRMSSVCASYVLLCHPYVTRMSSVCHSYVLVCHLYVTRIYSYVIRKSPVCGFTKNLNQICFMQDVHTKYLCFIFSHVAFNLSLIYMKCLEQFN